MQTAWSEGASNGWGAGPAPAAEPTGVGVPAADGADAVADDAVVVTADTADAASDGGEEEAHRSAADSVDELLDEVELALARLDDGTYGRCESCGSPIDDARLAASPIERTCGHCGSPDGVAAPSAAPAGVGSGPADG